MEKEEKRGEWLLNFILAAWELPSPSFCSNQQYLVSPFHEHPSRDDMFWHKLPFTHRLGRPLETR